MLNVYDVIAIGIASLTLLVIVKWILSYLHSSQARKSFADAMKHGIIRPIPPKGESELKEDKDE